MDLANALGHLAALGADLDLNRWEIEPPAPRPQKMVVPLSGTNYRTPGKKRPTFLTDMQVIVPKPLTPNDVDNFYKQTQDKPPTPMKTFAAMNTATPVNPSENQVVRHKEMNPVAGANVNEALAIVRKGLESIQSLQQQTAQAHQKFLETQAQASRTLQEMMKSTQIFFGSALGTPIPSVAEISTPAVGPQSISPRPLSMGMPLPTTAEDPPPAAPVPAMPTTQATVSPEVGPPENAASSIAAGTISNTLIDIVSELTGYPHDMLGLEMDIEADLGIDSIKRVEILSAMEERMPNLPQVTPEMVGTLKTLGQICDFLSLDDRSDGTTVPDKTEARVSSTQASRSVQQALLSVVAELTGYPDEMLGLEMDIEADLGIDSIKRVEILSAMEERMPHLPQVTPEMVGTLKTLARSAPFLAASKTHRQMLPMGVRRCCRRSCRVHHPRRYPVGSSRSSNLRKSPAAHCVSHRAAGWAS